jgi:hypothetical protein
VIRIHDRLSQPSVLFLIHMAQHCLEKKMSLEGKGVQWTSNTSGAIQKAYVTSKKLILQCIFILYVI